MSLSTPETPRNATAGDPAGPPPPPSVRIEQARAYSYRVPKTKVFSSRPYNYLVVLRAGTGGQHRWQGIGEAQPRSRRTGDNVDASWAFLDHCLAQLHGQQLSTATPEEALESVRQLVAQFTAQTAHVSQDGTSLSFRGTTLGIEIALLDLVARVLSLPLADLLGRRRDKAPLVPPAVDPNADFKVLRRTLKKQAESYQFARLNPASTSDRTLDFMELVATVNRRRSIHQEAKPLWIDFNGSYSEESAKVLVSEAVAAMAANHLPTRVVLEQPVPADEGSALSELQRHADDQALKTGRTDLDILIAADESLWDASSLDSIQEASQIRALNIRPAQAGGLLASLDLAERALAQNPDTLIFITRMRGASRVTAAALRHMALAMPKIDGAMVAAVVERSMPLAEYEVPADDSFVPAEDKASAGAAKPADSQSTPAVELIRSGSDEDTDSDDDDSEDSLGEQSDWERDQEIGSEPQGESADDRTSEAGEEGQDEDEDYEPSERDKLRGFGVKDVPGLGVRLQFTGLVSDVRNAVVYPVPARPTYAGKHATVYDDVDDLHPLGPNGSKGHLLEREALALGLNTVRYSKGAFIASDGKHEAISFKWSRNPISSAASLSICTHKEATRMQLQRHGVPVPQGRTFASGEFDTAKQFVGRIGYPVVVKPAMGVRGIGVVAGIQNEEQLDAAFEIMGSSRLGAQDFIVEKHVMGRDYRILVVGDEVVAAILREPASVLGDGQSTIAELLIQKNIARRRNPHLWARPIKYDAAAQHELTKSRRDLDSVLPEGERQLLANTCSLSQGGDSIDVLDELHPSIKEACVRAVNAMPDLEYCGVDFLLEDHTKPLDEQDAGICELNAHAAIGNCEYPMFGTPRKVAAKLMRACVEHYGFDVPDEPAENVALHLTIRGRVTKVGFRKWLKRRAEISGVSGWVKNVDDKTVEALIVGPTAPATAVAAATVLGPGRALPTSYTAEHVTAPESLDGFEIVVEEAPVEAEA